MTHPPASFLLDTVGPAPDDDARVRIDDRLSRVEQAAAAVDVGLSVPSFRAGQPEAGQAHSPATLADRWLGRWLGRTGTREASTRSCRPRRRLRIVRRSRASRRLRWHTTGLDCGQSRSGGRRRQPRSRPRRAHPRSCRRGRIHASHVSCSPPPAYAASRLRGIQLCPHHQASRPLGETDRTDGVTVDESDLWG